MYMKLRAVANSSLPKLAWVAEVNRTDQTVTLHHGLSVEVRQNFFVEGVWDGPFQNGDFGETDCVFGTGGILTEESIRFVTSAATTDYLYYEDKGAQVTVSNSLPLLLAYVRDSLDPHYPDYPLICDSVMDGIDDYRRDIPTKRGKSGDRCSAIWMSPERRFRSQKSACHPHSSVLMTTGTTWKTSTDSLRPMREMVHVCNR